MNAARWFATSVGIPCLLVGCANPQGAAEVGVPFNTNLVGYIKLDFTSQREVVNWFGSPLARTTMADGEGVETGITRYGYLHAGSRQFGAGSEYLEVEFNPDGLVTGVYFTQAEDGPPGE